MPRSTTLPRSSTMISSQSRIVLSRWATRTQVMPRRRTCRQDLALAHRIERAGGLVEHQDGRFADQRARDLDALALAAVEVAAALLDRALEVAAAGSGPVASVPHRRSPRPGAPGRHGVVPQGDVVAHGAAEQTDVLVDRCRRDADSRLAPPFVPACGRRCGRRRRAARTVR